MPEKSGRALILISCACAIFWPGAFFFGYPGVMSRHWQEAFNVCRSEIGLTVFLLWPAPPALCTSADAGKKNTVPECWRHWAPDCAAAVLFGWVRLRT